MMNDPRQVTTGRMHVLERKVYDLESLLIKIAKRLDIEAPYCDRDHKRQPCGIGCFIDYYEEDW